MTAEVMALMGSVETDEIVERRVEPLGRSRETEDEMTCTASGAFIDSVEAEGGTVLSDENQEKV